MHRYRCYWWVLLIAGIFGVLAGCSEPDDPGDIAFVMQWPTAAFTRASGDVPGSVEVALYRGTHLQRTMVLNHPETEDSVQALLTGKQTGEYTFIATGYTAADAQGEPVSRTRGKLKVHERALTTVNLTTQAALDAKLAIYPAERSLYVNYSRALYAIMTNPDKSFVLLSLGALTWSSSNTKTASIDPVTGALEGIDAGKVKITVTDRGTGISEAEDFWISHEPPTVDLTVDDDEIKLGESTKLHWVSKRASSVQSCTNFNTYYLNGDLSISPEESTTYSMTVSGDGGTATDSVTVKVVQPTPSVTISADPTMISSTSSQNGQYVTRLTWSSSNASSVKRAENFNTDAVNGSLTVSLTQTTTYSITVDGPGGEATASVTVTVR